MGQQLITDVGCFTTPTKDTINENFTELYANSGTPGGSDTQVQFNDGGSFGGDSGLTWDKTTNQLTVAGSEQLTGYLDYSIPSPGASTTSPIVSVGTITADLAATTDWFTGQNIAWIAAPTTDVTTEYVGLISTMSSATTHDIGNEIQGVLAEAYFTGIGSVSGITAGRNAAVFSNGSATTVRGERSTASVTNGTVTTVRGADVGVSANGGTITTLVGLDLSQVGISGGPTVTNAYGLRIGNQTVAGATTNYAIDVNGLFRVSPTGLNVSIGNGGALQTDTTTAHTVLLQAYDVDGAAYSTFATLTNGNTPSLNIAQPTGGILAIIPPTADPHVAGAIWNNTGILVISAG